MKEQNKPETSEFDALPLDEQAARYASGFAIYNSNEWPIAKAAYIEGHNQAVKQLYTAEDCAKMLEALRQRCAEEALYAIGHKLMPANRIMKTEYKDLIK